jgi:hypothetical protein
VTNGHYNRPDGTFVSYCAADLAWVIDGTRYLRRYSEDHNLLVELARNSG